MKDPVSLLDFSKVAAEMNVICREVVARKFQSASLEVRTKHDRSLVSEADEEIERRVQVVIEELFPGHTILGEEFNSKWTEAEYTWTIDPIDGTTPFVYGVPLFGSLLGLLKDGMPHFGAILLPSSNQILIGDGKSASCNGQPIQVAAPCAMSEAVLLTSDLTEMAKLEDTVRFNKLVRNVAIARTWGDCYGYAQVALGKATIMLDAGLSPWDIAPLVPVLTGAGAKVSDFSGGPITDGKGNFSPACLAAHPVLHQQVIDTLAALD